MRAWTKVEDDFVRQHKDRLSISEMAQRLGRTENAVQARKNRLGLTQSVRWDAEHDRVLAENYGRHPSSWPGWAEVLPGSTKSGRAARAKRLGLVRRGLHGFHEWTDEEERALAESLRRVSAELGVPAHTCVKRLKTLQRRASVGR